jgi:ABC-type multidrug transport system ATPase subunit
MRQDAVGSGGWPRTARRARRDAGWSSTSRPSETVDALPGVSIDVPVGELTAVMGPCGLGKSTLMHILSETA